MSLQELDVLVATGLLRDVEEVIVKAYLEAHPGAERSDVYRWLRYEDPDPIARLSDGVRRLRQMGVTFDAEAVDKACAEASKQGF